MKQNLNRRKTKSVYIGSIGIGSEHPISIQSMCNTKTENVKGTLAQLNTLAQAGAQIGRIAVPNYDAAANLPEIIKATPIPLVADIHFDYKLALAAINAGIAGLRLNPGNIRGANKIREVAKAAKQAGIPIRIGVNAGSITPKQWAAYPSQSEVMVQLALQDAETLESVGFSDIKISLKSSYLPVMLKAYRRIAELCDYPLHVGVTEAGTFFRGSLKNSLGIGALLSEGIGDTIRVSLTEDPIKEIKVAKEILIMLGLKKNGWQFISCPTCGRTEIDLINLTQRVEEALNAYQPSRIITVAIMGCIVNGPGEAIGADLGIAASKNGGLIFIEGKKIGFFTEEQLLPSFLEIAKKIVIE